MDKKAQLSIGSTGEEIATRFLRGKGFTIVARNFRKKFGEIDIICKKSEILHFVEVKSVSRRTEMGNERDVYRPEDNVHSAKLLRIGRTIQAFLFEHSGESEWMFDLVTVTFDHDLKTAKVKMLEDLIL